MMKFQNEVKVQGQRSPTMGWGTSSGGGLPTCQISKAYLERQKSYSPDTICYGSRDRFDLEVKIQGQRSPTMVRNTSSGGGLPTCHIWKACLERQKRYSSDMICYEQTDHYRASATKWQGPNNIPLCIQFNIKTIKQTKIDTAVLLNYNLRLISPFIWPKKLYKWST